MFGWDCILCRDSFRAATISTMMEVATLEPLEQNWQKSEWYSFYSIIYIHHVYNLLAHVLLAQDGCPWLRCLESPFSGRSGRFCPRRPALDRRHQVCVVSPVHARRCLLCYGFVWYCYISCTSHRPVTALGRLEARIPLVGHHKVNWAMKLIPTVTGKVRKPRGPQGPRREGGGSRPAILGLAGARTCGSRRGRQQSARTSTTGDRFRRTSTSFSFAAFLQEWCQAPPAPWVFLAQPPLALCMQMPSPQASVPPSGCGKAISGSENTPQFLRLLQSPDQS